MGKFEENKGLYTYQGHGLTLNDARLKSIAADALAGRQFREIAKRRNLPVKVVKEIVDHFVRATDA